MGRFKDGKSVPDIGATGKTQTANQLGGQAIRIMGKSGHGKTTIVWLLARKIADDLFIDEVDATKVTLAFLARFEQSMYLMALGKPGRVLIINEAHRLKADAVCRLLDVLEDLPSHVCVILTSTVDGQRKFLEEQIDAGPLLSRCIDVQLAQRGVVCAIPDGNLRFAPHWPNHPDEVPHVLTALDESLAALR